MKGEKCEPLTEEEIQWFREFRKEYEGEKKEYSREELSEMVKADAPYRLEELREMAEGIEINPEMEEKQG